MKLSPEIAQMYISSSLYEYGGLSCRMKRGVDARFPNLESCPLANTLLQAELRIDERI